ncbi:tRNA-dihydrouridine synthase A [Nematocida homosporus]|uniref:tRNA-dihydrouridine synthase A n=1 Tax=Nematocida homosporus TaxID=1912981 RepID=UPI00221F1A85|nr:tRNA-dihydrouridine synthase A [Nematocida homosporus]KAI5186627.1 tRNA-dihydrouridine synthase A [Nematocida homosporus]
MSFEIAVAPMVGVSTPEYRRFMRLISPNSIVFTEMIVDTSLLHMNSAMLEKKIGLATPHCALQIGGSIPEQVAQAAIRAVSVGYTRLNLNCGCPSDRVKSGSFGAVLMKTPETIAAIVQAVYQSTGVVMSVKCRIGLDQVEDYDSFKAMISTIVAQSPCRTFYVHARKCLLNGLSPAENRRVPPLRYDYALQIKRDFPQLKIILNGGIREINQIIPFIGQLDGVMLARKPMEDPFFFAELESVLFSRPPISPFLVISEYLNTLSTRIANQHAFYELDKEYVAKASQLSSSQHSDQESSPHTNTNPILTQPSPTTSYLCTRADLKPIEPVLFGKRGCKKYKQRLAEIAGIHLAPNQVLPLIEPYFSASPAISSSDSTQLT